jgi:hypothetical protein
MIPVYAASYMFATLMMALAMCGPGPGPDPYPGSTTPITCHAMDYTLPAVNAKTGRKINGLFFQCHVTAQGRETCVLKRR